MTINNIFLGTPKVGEKQCTEKKESMCLKWLATLANAVHARLLDQESESIRLDKLGTNSE